MVNDDSNGYVFFFLLIVVKLCPPKIRFVLCAFLVGRKST